MIEYATLDDFRQLTTVMLKQQQSSIVKSAAETRTDGATFLSHSSADAAYLPGVIKLLESHGARVHVDKKDPSLPPYTSRETGRALRATISVAKKFVLLATTGSKDSKWIPWELGLADGLRLPANLAILPGVENQTEIAWTEREYLGIYDRIVFGDLEGHPEKIWMVLNHQENTASTLSNWLAR